MIDPKAPSFVTRYDNARFLRIRADLAEIPQILSHEDQFLARLDQILLRNRELFPGKRVLDVGAGPGVFSAVAAHLGAQKVVAFEARAEHEEKFRSVWSRAGRGAGRIEFVVGPLQDLEKFFRPGEFDVILFAGTLYHLHDHVAPLDAAYRLGAEYLILETLVEGEWDAKPHSGLRLEPKSFIWNGVDGNREQVLRGHPTRSAVKLYLKYTGWSVMRAFDFANCPVPGTGLCVASGQRVVYTCKRYGRTA